MSHDVQTCLIRHERVLDVLFDFHVKQQGFSIEKQPDILYATGFHKFGAIFNLWPGIVSKDEYHSIFRTMTKDKTPNNIGLSNNDFFEALFRISIQGYENLQIFIGRTFPEMSPEIFEGLIKWLDLPSNVQKVEAKLKSMKAIHPNEKKKEVKLRQLTNSQNTSPAGKDSTGRDRKQSTRNNIKKRADETTEQRGRREMPISEENFNSEEEESEEESELESDEDSY